MKKKELGQHFLIDTNIVEKELMFADINKNDIILEIGPGKGALTIPLSTKAKQVITIEKDKILYEYLINKLPDNVICILADAISYDFSLLPRFTKVVSNLPYKISSPITFKFLKYKFKKAILLYQKEFAHRMIAKPNTRQYSRLSVGIHYHAYCNILHNVSCNSFFPKPKIESCIVELIPRKKPAFKLDDESFFFELTRNLFNYRRKKIKNIIQSKYNIKDTNIPFSEDRVEVLKPEQIGLLSNIIYSNIYHKH